jgi:hypothetical protein
LLVFMYMGCIKKQTDSTQNLSSQGKIERLILGPRLDTIIGKNDTVFALEESYIVSGKYSENKSYLNKYAFDEFVCEHLSDEYKRYGLYTITFYSESDITNNKTLAKYPNLFNEHTIITDKIRAYTLRKGKLKRLSDVFDSQQYPTSYHDDYTLDCLKQ